MRNASWLSAIKRESRNFLGMDNEPSLKIMIKPIK